MSQTQNRETVHQSRHQTAVETIDPRVSFGLLLAMTQGRVTRVPLTRPNLNGAAAIVRRDAL